MEFELKVKDIQLKYENNLNQEDLDKCVFNTENMNREIIKEKKIYINSIHICPLRRLGDWTKFSK